MNIFAPFAQARVVVATLSLAALASTSLADTLKLNATAYSGLGGVFTVTHSSPALSLSGYATEALYYVKGKNASHGAEFLGFGTFCLEYNEFFSPGATVDYTLAPYATNGGKDGASHSFQDPISLGTAWLYREFATGGLTTSVYTSASELAEFQSAIWFLEGEAPGAPALASPYGPLANLSNEYVQLAIGALGASYTNNANGAFGVSVLNLTASGIAKQSQLYYAPTAVPDSASSLVLTLMGLALVAFRRRLSK